MLCREPLPVIWLSPTTIKEIKLFLDPKDESSYLGTLRGKPFCPTIDDNNLIHFWIDGARSQHAGSIHISELD